MSSQNRLLMTYSLLNAWMWYIDTGNEEDWLNTLNRVRTESNESMKRGFAFEDWAAQNLPELKGAIKQAGLYKDITIDGQPYLLYGKLDFLKAGVMSDTKWTARYDVGKFRGSPQHPMYFALVPEASKFVYIICTNPHEFDADELYREEYLKSETDDIVSIIKQFIRWLKDNKYFDLYCEKWGSK